MIPYSKQFIDDKDIKSVVKVLKSPLITQGSIVPKFENKVASRCGSKYSFAVNSATSALHLACLALDLKKGDTIWTVPNTFVASANCGLYCGAKVDFVDININTYNICVDSLSEKLENAEKKNKLPKILIPVHFAGHPTKQDEIWRLSKKYKFKIIEDASHSLGAKYKNEDVGSCKWSDITIFSFHPVKMITTGEGGMLLTNDRRVASKVELLRNSGITRNSKLFKVKNREAWYYEQQLLGFNYRMTDIQAALGLSQINKLNKFLSKRNKIAKKYNKLLSSLPIRIPEVDLKAKSSFHLYVIRLNDYSSRSYKKIFNYLRKNGIGVNLHYLPVHLHPYYRSLGFKEGDFPNAEKYSSEALSIPIHYELSDNEQVKIVSKISAIL